MNMKDNRMFQIMNRINSILFLFVLAAAGMVIVASLMSVNDWKIFSRHTSSIDVLKEQGKIEK